MGETECAPDQPAKAHALRQSVNAHSPQDTPRQQTRKSNCHYCGYLCGFLATVEDDGERERLVDLQPDPSRYPYDPQITRSCRRWQMNLSEIDGSERVNYPLKRRGQRGSGQWQRIGWDQALDEIASKLSELAAEHGPQTLATAIGGPHAVYWPLHRFMNLWGSPNNMGIGQICWNIRIWMDTLAYGWPIESHIDPNHTKQVFLWGTNPAESDNSLFWRALLRMRKQGIPLVVIDPRQTATAKSASLHLMPRPATDCTLALALIREIIHTNRHNQRFVERWCHGFDELVKHVEPFTLHYAKQVTGVAARDIAAAAELFSRSGPTALLSGRGIDQLGPATAPAHRALSILRAICGDVDRPGACHIMEMSDFIPEIDLEMSEALSPEAHDAQLNRDFSPLQSYPGYKAATQLTARLGRTDQNPLGKRLPMRYVCSAHPNLVWRAALGQWPSGGKPPYRVSALICMAANPLVTYADTKLVYQALHSLDLLVVLEQYLSPTAQLADYVLPAAGAFEQPQFQAHGGVANLAYGGAAACAPYHQRRSDYDFFRDLGLRLGQQGYWPSASLKEAIAATLAPTGLSFAHWTERGIYVGKTDFYKHEAPGPNGQPQGFATTTGKIELASEFLPHLGTSRLPQPAAVCAPTTMPVCAPTVVSASASVSESALATPVAKSAPVAASVPAPSPASPGGASEDFNLILLTGARHQPYWASSYFNNPEFRRIHPDPTAEMSAATLKRLGIRPGQWVMVATARGQARFVAAAASMIDEVVSCEYGWWYPEEPAGEPNLSGIWRSNINLLTSADIEYCEPLIGSWNYNAIPCRVSLCDSL
ncbi:MAG: molybdopterin-dependent oxidoreductase [Coriobacteriales bacterium]|jgi:anaerobic selenocysteine-containing dehydrogenase|nr:molybdopterin-dependent oxidoreductase [Coriobacteriales bacterium]